MLKIEDYISRMEQEKGICIGEELSKELFWCAEVDVGAMQRVLDVLNRYDVKIGKCQFSRLIYPIELMVKEENVLFYERLMDAIEVAIAVETAGLKVRGRMIVSNDNMLRDIGNVAKRYILNELLPYSMLYEIPDDIESCNLGFLKEWRDWAIDGINSHNERKKLSNKKKRIIPELYLILAPSFFDQGAVFWVEGQDHYAGNMRLGACIYDIMVEMKMVEERDYYDMKSKFDAVKGFLKIKGDIKFKRLIISGENIKGEEW